MLSQPNNHLISPNVCVDYWYFGPHSRLMDLQPGNRSDLQECQDRNGRNESQIYSKEAVHATAPDQQILLSLSHLSNLPLELIGAGQL